MMSSNIVEQLYSDTILIQKWIKYSYIVVNCFFHCNALIRFWIKIWYLIWDLVRIQLDCLKKPPYIVDHSKSRLFKIQDVFSLSAWTSRNLELPSVSIHWIRKLRWVLGRVRWCDKSSRTGRKVSPEFHIHIYIHSSTLPVQGIWIFLHLGTSLDPLSPPIMQKTSSYYRICYSATHHPPLAPYALTAPRSRLKSDSKTINCYSPGGGLPGQRESGPCQQLPPLVRKNGSCCGWMARTRL